MSLPKLFVTKIYNLFRFSQLLRWTRRYLNKLSSCTFITRFYTEKVCLYCELTYEVTSLCKFVIAYFTLKRPFFIVNLYVFYECLDLYIYYHISHINKVFCQYEFVCVFKWLFCLNFKLRMLHSKGFSPLWVSICLSKSLSRTHL